MAILFSNNASTTLSQPIASGVTTINVVDASKFPTPSGGDYFLATLQSSSGAIEIVKVTARSGNALTVVRVQEGTVAGNFEAGSFFSNRVTKETLDQFAQKDGEVQTDLYSDGVWDSADPSRATKLLATSTAEAGKLLALNGDGKLPSGLAGNADTASNSALLGGQNLAYVLDRANHTGVSSLVSGNTAIFTGNGIWSKPQNLARVKVTVVGGGGSGGQDITSGDNTSVYNGGGGGGGTSIRIIPASSLPSGVSVVVGGAGQASSFGGFATATAGGNGSSTSAGAGGTAGGSANESFGVLNLTGDSGYGGFTNRGVGGQTGMGIIGMGAGTGHSARAGIVIVEEYYA